MAAPVCAHIREFVEAMRNTMIDLLLVWICLGVGLADTLGDNTSITLCVASIFAILALHTRRVFEKISTESTTHDVVKLLRNKFVAVHLMNFLFSLTDSTFSVESEIERSLVLRLLCEAKGQVDSTRWLQCKPRINRLCRYVSCTHSSILT